MSRYTDAMTALKNLACPSCQGSGNHPENVPCETCKGSGVRTEGQIILSPIVGLVAWIIGQ